MNRRTGWILGGCVGVVCLALVLSVAYPLSTADPHAANAPGERFTVGTADAFSATGRIAADGDVALAFDGIVTEDGAWYQQVVEPNVTSWEYYPGAGETVHQRVRITGQERADRFRQAITDDATRDLVRRQGDGNHTTLVFTQDGIDGSEPVSGTASVFINSLSIVAYERTGSTTAALTPFTPQSGWYEGSQPYRITGASGTIRANTDRMAVHSANVSWMLTAPAGSFAEYALVRVTGGAPTTRTLSFEYTPGAATLERPAWVGTDHQASVVDPVTPFGAPR